MANYFHWQYPAKTEPVFVPAPVPSMDGWFTQLSQPLVLPPVPATEGAPQLAIDPTTFRIRALGGAAVGLGFPHDGGTKKRDIDIAVAVGVWMVFGE